MFKHYAKILKLYLYYGPEFDSHICGTINSKDAKMISLIKSFD